MAEVDRDESTLEIRGGRRKFCEADDIALLKEALAHNAHVCRRGKLTEKFEEVAVSLNDSSALPWPTNGKHCTDRFKLLVANFRRIDRARSSASGIEEEYGEKDQLLADIVSAIDDTEERTRLERENVLRRDDRLAKAGQEVRATAMKRKGSDRSGPDEENGENEDDEFLPPSRESDDAVTPSRTTRGKKRHKHQSIDLEELIATNQERKAEQEILKLRLETDRLEFEKEREAAHERNEERRLQILSSQADLQRQQQNDNSRMQLKMLQVMDEMMKKLG
jgi:hypothetical protein